MTPEQIRAIVGSTPHTSPPHGREIYDFIREHRLQRCLELGFAHGVGTVWIAGAVKSVGGGQVIAVDNESARLRKPSAQDLIRKAGLSSLVQLHFDSTSYTWHLKRNLASYKQEPFDFIFIDGAHNWDTDGFTFFLAERILKIGGWLLFDDLDWSYAKSPSLKESSFVRALPDEQRNIPQVRAVWEQLVLEHPAFGNFKESHGWGWAQKTASDAPRHLEIRRTSSSKLQAAVRKLKQFVRS